MINSYLLKGKANYAKIVGKPVGGYPNGEGPEEWTVDVVLDDASKQSYLKSGGSPFYIKSREGIGEYIRFVRKAVKQSGDSGKPIEIIDHAGHAWGTRLIGNGSTLNVSYTLNEVTAGKERRLKPSILRVQVWDHVPYQPKSEFPTRDSDVAQSEGKVATDW